jgi:hypothetical protein
MIATSMGCEEHTPMNKLTTQRTNLLLLFVVGLGTVIGLNSLIPSVAFA